jgi:hypothetical protein
MSDFTVTIGGSRGDEWERIAGTRTFPVRSPIPVLADLPGKPSAQVYLLDLASIAEGVRGRIVGHLSRKFGLSPDEAEAEATKQGIPILADECSVMIEHPQRWF